MGICKPDIFKTIFNNQVDRLQRTMVSRGLSMEDAADVVQESFTRLWQKCKSIEQRGAASYLMTTCNRLLIDRHRSAQVRLRFKQSAHHPEVVNKEDPQYRLEEQEFKVKMERAMSTMPEKSREVFMMHRFNDMSYKEIAALLDLSVKAIEKRMHKALKHLVDANIIQKK